MGSMHWFKSGQRWKNCHQFGTDFLPNHSLQVAIELPLPQPLSTGNTNLSCIDGLPPQPDSLRSLPKSTFNEALPDFLRVSNPRAVRYLCCESRRPYSVSWYRMNRNTQDSIHRCR